MFMRRRKEIKDLKARNLDMKILESDKFPVEVNPLPDNSCRTRDPNWLITCVVHIANTTDRAR